MDVDPYAPCSARAFCPEVCPEETMPCPKGLDYDGCPSPDGCYPINPDCPSVCPAVCGLDEMYCPGSSFEVSYGQQCQHQDFCIPAKNVDCPAHCPVECGNMEIMCPGAIDDYGCAQPDFCLPTDPFYPTFCPKQCNSDELLCPGGYDSYTQMPLEDFCVPINPDCPTFCPAECYHGDMKCPGG